MQKVIVSGAAGDQGRAIMKGFIEANWAVVGLTRDSQRLAIVEAGGAKALAVDDSDCGALTQAFTNADVLVFNIPADYRDGVRESLAVRYAEAARKAGVSRVIVNTAASVLPGSGPNALALRQVEDTFLEAIPSSVALEPTIYLDNLSAPWLIAQTFADGGLSYAQPAHAKVSWISHATLAQFVVAAATSDAASGKRLAIGGQDAFDGPGLATAMGTVLGRELEYRAVPLSKFVDKLNGSFGAPAGDRIAENFVHAVNHPEAMVASQAAAELLNVLPESFAEWANRQDWTPIF